MRATKVPRGVVLLYASAFLMAYEQVISFDNLYKGLKESCRNIRWKDSTVGYEGNALKNTYRLRQTLLNGTYKIDRYQHFTIYEPKRRDIVATRLKDRQFQRSLCDNGFYEQITKSFMEELYIQSLSTVYDLRNRAVAEFALLYFGGSALGSI